DKPTPLATFLYIYSHAQHDCFIDYMEGAKLLAVWLDKLVITKQESVQVPAMLRTYELVQLAKIIHPQNTNFAEDAIYCELVKESHK
ncbi:MAG: hypothetical protein DRH08_10410, partial [Deltaproteobacteria bacterium]